MNNDWPEYIAAKPDKTWANMPHGQTYVHIRRHMLISGNLDDARKRIADLEAQLAQRDAALKAADGLARVSQTLLDEYGFASNGSDNYREVRVCDIAGLDNAREIYRKARGQDAD